MDGEFCTDSLLPCPGFLPLYLFQSFIKGVMQEAYTHGVAAVREKPTLESSASESSASNRRIAIVFRNGEKIIYKNDSGRPCMDIKPRVIVREPVFGPIPEFYEGELYSREALLTMRAHTGQQRGVSGNMHTGCDAIVVSGRWKGRDEFLNLFYSADSRVGGKALDFSAEKALPIRVFRSTAYKHTYRAAIPLALSKVGCTLYRFDGLYLIEGREGESVSGRVFHLRRLEYIKNKKNLPAEELPYHNKIRNAVYRQYCLARGTGSLWYDDHTHSQSTTKCAKLTQP